MEADHISREAAIAAFSTNGSVFVYGQKACKAIISRLKLIPAADVRPVVRGHYVGEYDGYADGNPVYDMWYCSECGCCFEDWDEKPTYNFCPNCGADMRAEKTVVEAITTTHPNLFRLTAFRAISSLIRLLTSSRSAVALIMAKSSSRGQPIARNM